MEKVLFSRALTFALRMVNAHPFFRTFYFYFYPAVLYFAWLLIPEFTNQQPN